MTFEGSLVDHYAGVQKRLRTPPTQPEEPKVIYLRQELGPEQIARISALEAEVLRLSKFVDAFTAKYPHLVAAKADLVWNATPATLAQILKCVCCGENVTRIDLLSERRTKKIALARHIYCWLALKLSTRGSSEVGRLIGNRDHTTVLSAQARIEKLSTSDVDLRGKLDRYLTQLQGISTKEMPRSEG